MNVKLLGIPMPPSANALYSGIAKRTKSEKYKIWQNDFDAWAWTNIKQVQACSREMATHHNLEEPLCLEVVFWFHRERIYSKSGAVISMDSSNRLKAIHDALAKTLGIDDRFFFDGTFYKRPLPPGRTAEVCDIRFRPIDASDNPVSGW